MDRELTGDAAATLDQMARGKIDSVVAANEVTLLKLILRFREERPAGDLLKLTLDEQRELNDEITSATVKEGDGYLVALQEVFHDPEEYEGRARECSSIFAKVALSRWQRLTDGIAFETVTSNYDVEIEGVSHDAFFHVLTELRDRVERRVLEMWERYSVSQADFDKTLVDQQQLPDTVAPVASSTDAGNGTESASRKSERPGDVLRAQEAQVPMESRKTKKPVRRNQKYKVIDKALQEIAESRPSTQEEIFQSLEERHVAFPPAEPFMAARGWIKGFRLDVAAARAWLSKRWAELNLPPLPRGPKNPKK